MVSSLTHRLGADLPREKYGATAAAMRYEEKQSAVRFHVPEAGINERCLGELHSLSLSASYEMRAHGRGRVSARGMGHRMCTGERHLRFDGVAREEKHGRPLASVTQRRLDESSCSPSDCVPVETRW